MNNQDVDFACIQKGNITCNRNILLSIISLATKEISGVANLVNERSWLKRLFSRNETHGVKIAFDQNGNVNVHVYISVYFGYNVPDVACKIQANIKNSISSMIDMKASKVSVHVCGVVFSKPEPATL